MSAVSRLSVVGLGKLGACLAACLADRGFAVVGVDRDGRVVDCIRSGRAPVIEPGLTELIARNSERLTATTDPAVALDKTDLTFVVVPTPSRSDGSFSTDYVEAVATELGSAYRKADYHVFVLVSTVLPGDTEATFVRTLERTSAKRLVTDFGVCYSPEFIALGEVIRGVLRPELQLIGESDRRAGDVLEQVYARLSESRPTIVRTSFVNAELAKIALNAFVTMKITFANVLGQICEALPGSDVDVVTEAIGVDGRIGRRYLKSGLGFGGPCFPRDDVAFGHVARIHGVSSLLQDATHAINNTIPSRVAGLVKEYAGADANVAILGLAYKPDTPVVEGSQGLEIARILRAEGYRLTLFDALAAEVARRELGDGVHIADSLDAAVRNADVIVVANRLLGLEQLRSQPARRVVVIDCWRAAGHLAQDTDVCYVSLGRGREPE